MKIDRKMTVWGIGPTMALITVPVAVILLFVHFWMYPVFVIPFPPPVVYIVAGILCIAVGFPLWLLSAITIDYIFKKKVLATKGVYGIARNPLYGGSFLVHLGIIFFFRSWILMIVPFVFYAVFRLLVKKEEAYLEAAFGDDFRRYRKEINALFPDLGNIYSAFFYPARTENIGPGLCCVKNGDVNLYIYRSGTHAICFDAGYRSGETKKEMEKLGIDPGTVTHLFLTHGDTDHAGGHLYFPNARIYLGVDEVQMTNGKRARFLGLYHSPVLKREYDLVRDEDEIIIGAAAVKALAAPGHTPGHTAYLLNNEILFTGDAVILQNGSMAPFYRPFNMDNKRAVESAKRLARMKGISMICTAHTGYTRMVEGYGEYLRSENRQREDIMAHSNYYLKRKKRMVRQYAKLIEKNSAVLRRHMEGSEADAVAKETLSAYEELIPGIPYIGGRENFLTPNLVGAVQLLALIRVLGKKGYARYEIGGLLYDLYAHHVASFPGILKAVMRKLFFSRFWRNRMRQGAHRSRQGRFSGDWVFDYVPGDGYDFEYGITHYECGICAYYERMGAADYVPYLCLLDYPKFRELGVCLDRSETLGNGGRCCDFRFYENRIPVEGWPPENIREFKKP